MSLEVTGKVWRHSEHKGASLLLLLAIADHASPQGEAFPSVATLAGMARISVRHASRALQELQESGELEIAPNEGRFGCNFYQINLPALEAKPDNIKTLKDSRPGRKPPTFAPKPPTSAAKPPTFATQTPDTGVRGTVIEPPINRKGTVTEELDLALGPEILKIPDWKNPEKAMELYKAYPIKKDRAEALKEIAKALKKESFETLMAAVAKYAASRKVAEGFIKNPANWFKAEAWADEDPTSSPSQKNDNATTAAWMPANWK